MMTLACPTCREVFGLSLALAGKSFTCPSCRVEIVLPRPEDIHKPGPSIRAAFSVNVTCPRCARLLSVEPDKAAGWLACPSCSLVFMVAPPAAPAPPVPPPLPPDDALPDEDEAKPDKEDDGLDELRERRKRKAKKRVVRRWLFIGGFAGLLVIAICAGCWMGIPVTKTGRMEAHLKRKIEYDHGIPIERVDLVPYGEGYRGVVKTKRGYTLEVLVYYEDGVMKYHAK